MQVPIGIEASLQGVVDLVKMKAIVWKNEDLGAEWEEKDIPADLKEICEVRYKPTNYKLFEITGINMAEAIHNAKLTICSLKADWDDLNPNQKTQPYMISLMDMLDDWNNIEFKAVSND